jgi:hypothetical protein
MKYSWYVMMLTCVSFALAGAIIYFGGLLMLAAFGEL